MSLASVSILDHFASLPDPRLHRTRLHSLGDILVIALCAVLGGADSWPQVAAFGDAKIDFFKRLLALPNGIPSHDTFNRVFSLLRPGGFEDCFLGWMNAACSATGLQRLHVDGKTLRGSRKARGSFARAMHTVSAWAGANHLTLGQVAVDGKSNEITAIPRLLQALDLSGCIVTIDAMGCQRAIAAQIIAGGGHYVLALKENQPGLHREVEALFDAAVLGDDLAGLAEDGHASEEAGHGRREARTYQAINSPALSGAADWPGLAAVVMVTREREQGGKYSQGRHYYLSSVSLRGPDWEEVIRGHWGIESMHWVLDVVFREDECRTRDANAAQNHALLRRVAVSLLKRDGSPGSLVEKRKRAGWDDKFLDRLLSSLSHPGAPPSTSPPVPHQPPTPIP